MPANEDDMLEQMIKKHTHNYNMAELAGIACTALFRIARAQEVLVELARADLEAAVEGEAQSRAEQMANEIVEEKSKRSFIGRK